MTAKQYLRHMPPWVEGNMDGLFLSCINKPASIVWYNRAFKVGKGTSAGWLKNMLKLVGLPDDLFSNKSGRATLITRLAAGGVPDQVGMLLSGHHTTDGYGRYDRTKDLQQEAAALVIYNPGMTYEMALTKVSKRFVEEDLKGNIENLKPLVYPVPEVTNSSAMNSCVPEAGSSSSQLATAPAHVQTEASILDSTLPAMQATRILRNLYNEVPKQIQDCSEELNVKVNDPPNKLAVWNKFYDGIDWEAAMQRDSKLASILGGGPRVPPVANFSNCQNCAITINMPPMFNPPNFDWAKILAFNKENNVPEEKK